jgi:radical SAM/Cys-rich protein
VVASLPCYGEENVNQQRGNGVFDRSIAGLQKLNEAGYGQPDSGLQLDLVYNPLGGFLPPPQGPLEVKYKEELRDQFGIEFNNLFCITNMPIKRFADFLSRRGELQAYMELLVRNFNPAACSNVMCTSYLSVDYRGVMYDCDFNQQLEMSFDALELTSKVATGAEAEEQERLLNDVKAGQGQRGSLDESPKLSVFDIERTDDMMPLKIKTANHCFGCVSGMGSSCQGTTA